MNEPTSGGFLARLRENEMLRKLSGGRPELIIFGAAGAARRRHRRWRGGRHVGRRRRQQTGDREDADRRRIADEAGRYADSRARTPGLKTPIAISPGSELAPGDLSARGVGTAGRGAFTGVRLVIPKIGIDAEFSVQAGRHRRPDAEPQRAGGRRLLRLLAVGRPGRAAGQGRQRRAWPVTSTTSTTARRSSGGCTSWSRATPSRSSWKMARR